MAKIPEMSQISSTFNIEFPSLDSDNENYIHQPSSYIDIDLSYDAQSQNQPLIMRDSGFSEISPALEKEHYFANRETYKQLISKDIENNINTFTDNTNSLSPFDQQREAQNFRKLAIATSLCSIFFIIELTGGLMAGSLALLSDSFHLLTGNIQI